MNGYEFVMTLPDGFGQKRKYLCSYDIHIGDKTHPMMDDFDIDWRDKTHLFDINDPHIVERLDEFDDTWGETKIVTSHGYGRKSDYFKIVKPL